MNGGKMRKKVVFIDTNVANDNESYFIHDIVIRSMGLKAGDKVIAYQESDSWDAEIVFSDGKWGVILKSETEEISREREEGHKEGFWEGSCLQKINIIKILQELNAPPQLIEKVKEKLDIN